MCWLEAASDERTMSQPAPGCLLPTFSGFPSSRRWVFCVLVVNVRERQLEQKRLLLSLLLGRTRMVVWILDGTRGKLSRQDTTEGRLAVPLDGSYDRIVNFASIEFRT